jgi:ABC-type nickel/cobalt efflux system permease component RcnA
MTGLLTVMSIGFLLGFRHAFEPDHLAAVTTLATRQGTVRDAARLGAAWGAGHTAAIAVVALILIYLDLSLPRAVGTMAELLVAALLIGLGCTVLLRHAQRHRHELDSAHERAHALGIPHAHTPPIRDARRSLGFGLAHGLAGSGAVMVLLVAAAPGRAERLLYLGGFGTGTILGMLGVSGLVALLARTAASGGERWALWLHLATATASIVVGIGLALETAVN